MLTMWPLPLPALLLSAPCFQFTCCFKEDQLQLLRLSFSSLCGWVLPNPLDVALESESQGLISHSWKPFYSSSMWLLLCILGFNSPVFYHACSRRIGLLSVPTTPRLRQAWPRSGTRSCGQLCPTCCSRGLRAVLLPPFGQRQALLHLAAGSPWWKRFNTIYLINTKLSVLNISVTFDGLCSLLG